MLAVLPRSGCGRRILGMVWRQQNRCGIASLIWLAAAVLAGGQEERQTAGPDLRNADLSFADHRGAKLRGANLAGAKIDRTKFDDADLRDSQGWDSVTAGWGLDAARANFSGTDLRGARLHGGHQGGNFSGADFSDADLRDAVLVGWFEGAKFTGANLQGALFCGVSGLDSELEGFRKRGALVTAADFAQAVAAGRSFHGLMLSGANLSHADVRGADFSGSYWHSGHLPGAQLQNANLRKVEWYWLQAADAQFQNADLTNSNFHSVTADRANFDGAKLAGADLSSSKFPGASFRQADLTGVNFSGCDLTGADLTGAKLDGIIVTSAILESIRGLPSETASELHTQAARWKVERAELFNRFVREWSTPLQFLGTVAGVACCLFGRQTARARKSFSVLLAINLLSSLPGLAFVLFLLCGGSPVVQMSDQGLWSTWVGLFPILVLYLLTLLVAALGASLYHLVRFVLLPPREQIGFSLAAACVTPLTCIFAGLAFFLLAPTA